MTEKDQSPQRSRLSRVYWGPGEKDKHHQGETGNVAVDPEHCVRCRLETFR